MRHEPLTPLRRLARAYGVLTKYRDGFRKLREPSDDSIVAVLQALGVPVRGPDDGAEALAAYRRDRWASALDPVIVSWAGRGLSFTLRLPKSLSAVKLESTLEFEGGATISWIVQLGEGKVVRSAQVGGETFHVLRVDCDFDVPIGYHVLHVKLATSTHCAMLIRAPRSAPELERTWGVFLPLYALRTERSLGAGDLSDLATLIDWVDGLGGGLAGILPILATFPENPSPYTPLSRLFWNESYLDPRRLPEWTACPEAAALLASTEARDVITHPLRSRHVDFNAANSLRRKLIERLACALSGERLQQYTKALESSPMMRRYAEFRGRIEIESGLAVGRSVDGAKYHAYSQWAVEQQLSEVADSARKKGPGLYLDLPLGVHPEGFDRFENPEAFASSVTGGAPPDRFFSKGQNWGFAPLNPLQLRASGHKYFIDCIRTQMRYAGVLRIDHVMGLHRQYWIPSGGDSDQGVYVQYPADELYAILCLEAGRNGTAVVGEDLGTVPDYIRSRMQSHGLQRMFVSQFELKPDPANALPDPPANAVASINTHDTPTFASYWNGDDIRDQQALGLLEAQHAETAMDRRQNLKRAACDYFGQPRDVDPNKILEKCLNEISASQASCVVVNLEDLWGETEPQNTPGTDKERPNWSRRAKYSFEEFSNDTEILRILANVDKSRKSSDAEQPKHD